MDYKNKFSKNIFTEVIQEEQKSTRKNEKENIEQKQEKNTENHSEKNQENKEIEKENSNEEKKTYYLSELFNKNKNKNLITPFDSNSLTKLIRIINSSKYDVDATFNSFIKEKKN